MPGIAEFSQLSLIASSIKQEFRNVRACGHPKLDIYIYFSISGLTAKDKPNTNGSA